MTDLMLIRREADGLSTRGELHLHPGPQHLCYTLENPWLDNRRGASSIPVGRWPLRLRGEGGYHAEYTKRFAWHEEMVEVVVPDRTFILFHIGNYHRNTDGCILVGDRKGTDFEGDGSLTVWGSEDAYTRVYRHLHEAASSDGHLHVIDATGEGAQ